MRAALAWVIASMLAVNPAIAQPPPGHGGGKKHDDERRDDKGKGKGKDRDLRDERRQDSSSRERDRERDRADGRRPDPARPPATVGRRFEDRHRVIVRDYYVTEFRSGHCPPGLAKKNNGCMPPGQAKKWKVGHPLPREVIFHDLPPALVVQIGAPPPGYRFVRVAADILLIAIGTGMVIDAITDLGNM